MKKIVFLILLLFICYSVNAQKTEKDTILLFNPTVSNISTIEFLIEHDILQLDDPYFKGVYHTNESYDYSQSSDFLALNTLLPFSLKEVTGELPAEQIYLENSCSGVFKNLFDNSKGAIFMGGPDLPPTTYNESTHLLTRIMDPGRHYLELSFLFHILGGNQDKAFKPLMKKNPEYAVLGICLGMQTINVATGGTMIQDIPHEVYGYNYVEDILDAQSDMIHTNYNLREPGDEISYTSYHFHPILLNQDFPLPGKRKEISENHPFVLSSHHQAIEDLGKGLSVVASSMDGRIIEAVVHRKYKNVIGVQFHPEKTSLFTHNQQFRVSPDSIIDFNQFLIETDSYLFHRKLWENISVNFKQ